MLAWYCVCVCCSMAAYKLLRPPGVVLPLLVLLATILSSLDVQTVAAQGVAPGAAHANARPNQDQGPNHDKGRTMSVPLSAKPANNLHPQAPTRLPRPERRQPSADVLAGRLLPGDLTLGAGLFCFFVSGR